MQPLRPHQRAQVGRVDHGADVVLQIGTAALLRQRAQLGEIGPVKNEITALWVAGFRQHIRSLLGGVGHFLGQELPITAFRVLPLHIRGADAAGVHQQTAAAAILQQRLDVVIVVFQPENIQQLRLRHKAGDIGKNRLPLLLQTGLQGSLVVDGLIPQL